MSELQSNSESLGLAPAPAASASFLERWYVLIMMCLVYTLSIADRYVVSTVLDPIRQELNLFTLAAGRCKNVFYCHR